MSRPCYGTRERLLHIFSEFLGFFGLGLVIFAIGTRLGAPRAAVPFLIGVGLTLIILHKAIHTLLMQRGKEELALRQDFIKQHQLMIRNLQAQDAQEEFTGTPFEFLTPVFQLMLLSEPDDGVAIHWVRRNCHEVPQRFIAQALRDIADKIEADDKASEQEELEKVSLTKAGKDV